MMTDGDEEDVFGDIFDFDLCILVKPPAMTLASAATGTATHRLEFDLP